MASFLARGLQLPPTSSDYFSDDDSTLHEDAINAVREAGVASGCGATTYCPGAVVGRDHMASFLAQALDFVGR